MNNSNNTMFIDRSNYCINILKNEIKKYDVLTNEQERELCESMKMGDKSARDKLINSNLRFVFIKAKKYCWGGVDFLDLFQAGTIGLMEAVDRYDVSKDVTLLSYAVYWIESELLKTVKEHKRYSCNKSLEDKLPADNDSRRLLDVMNSDREDGADWNIRYALAMKAIKAQVKQAFFPEAADLWEDYLIMREQGYCVADVAKKHNVPEERTREIIKDINHALYSQGLL
jgi:RNA polymerase sigma factor (sigma-70 family)